MVIIETSIFTRQLRELLSDDVYRELQSELIKRPDAGLVIPGTGGLRKLRWGYHGQGKRGGVRIIYYWITQQERLLMLFIYPKSARDNLSPTQLKALKQVVEAEYP